MGIFDKIAEKLSGQTEGMSGSTEGRDDEQEEKKIAAWIRSKVEEARSSPARITFESQVVTNTAYLLGYDSVYFDARSRQLRSFGNIDQFPRRNRIHANLVLPTIQNRLSRLCKSPPKFDVRPNSNDQEDKEAARLTLKVIEHVLEKERANEKRQELYMWMQQAGFAFLKVYWDDQKGEKKYAPGDIDPLTGEESKGETFWTGDIGLDVVSPLEMFVDPLAKSMDDAAWVIQAKVRKLEYFRDKYGDKGKEVKEEGAWLLSTQNLLRIQNMTSRGTTAPEQNQMKNAAIELAYYEKPSKKYPNGRMIVTANGVELCYKDLPVGEINFVKFDDVKIGGKFYSESVVTHMRPLQDQYNRNMRKKAEYLNKSLALKFMAAKGHGLIAESITDSTEVYEYNPVDKASKPESVQAPQLPQYVFSDTEQIKFVMDQISGMTEPTSGVAPSGSIPAIGMQLLVEQTETRVGVVTESNENSWADIGRLIAKYACYYYKMPRIYKEAGQNQDYRIFDFTGADLREHFDVIVLKGSTLPGSKVLKRQDLMNLYQQGLLGDPMDPAVREKVLNGLEFGDLGQVWEDYAVDMSQIKRSIEEIEQGIVPIVSEDDNHDLHYQYKNRIRKTEKFEKYDPLIQQIFLQDLEQHKMFLMPPMPPPGMMGPDGMPMAPPPMEEMPMEEVGLEEPGI